MEYRYPHFQRQALLEDLSFHGGPAPGQPMPDFDVPTIDGVPVRKSDFVGPMAIRKLPLLLTFASITCPMTASAGPVLKALHREFFKRVAFVSLYVREAHPGERYPQPSTFEEKVQHARDYKERDDIPWPVAVDNLVGDLHRALGGNANAAYLMDMDGNVAFRTLWSNDEHVLRQALEEIVAQPRGAIGQSEPKVIPMMKGMGVMHDVLTHAGHQAVQDVERQTPAMYALARLASAFSPLPPLGRGLAAVATITLGLLVLIGGLRWLAGQRD